MEQTDLFTYQLPELPYAGTSGHSGTDTSKTRAESQDSTGKTAQIQRQILVALEIKRERGTTWKELAESMDLHHGTISGLLSVLHKTGRISRLEETRKGCKVYVDNEWTNGRTTELQGVKKSCPNCGCDL